MPIFQYQADNTSPIDRIGKAVDLVQSLYNFPIKSQELEKARSERASAKEKNDPTSVYSKNQQMEVSSALGELVKSGDLDESTVSPLLAGIQSRSGADLDDFKKSSPLFSYGMEKAKARTMLAGNQMKIDAGVAAENKKPPTQGQSIAAKFGSQMANANAGLDELLSGGFDPTTVRSGIESKLPAIGQSTGAQQLEQFKREFVTADLRRDSGAAISPSEYESANKKYFPSVGDSPEVLEQKAESRRLAIAALQAEAGDRALGGIQKRLPKKVAGKSGGGPKVGHEEGGYIFQGGNPADQKNWKKK